MNWETWKTPFYAECFVAVGSAGYLLTALCINHFKGERKLKYTNLIDESETEVNDESNKDLEY